MSKRSANFERRPRDFYPTPVDAIPALAEHLSCQFTFAEPYAGDGALTQPLQEIGGRCVAAYDIAPRRRGVLKREALSLNYGQMNRADLVTNPPWTRPILHALIDHCADYSGPVWFLFDADWWLTVQAVPYLKHVRKIVAVGRLRWIPASKHTGFDNAEWIKFGRVNSEGKVKARATPSKRTRENAHHLESVRPERNPPIKRKTSVLPFRIKEQAS